MIIIHADMKIVPEKKEVFLQQMQALVSASQAEEGNVRYTLMQSVNDANFYTMVEEWKDQAAFEFHNQSAHFQKFIASAPEFMAVPLQAAVFKNAEQE